MIKKQAYLTIALLGIIAALSLNLVSANIAFNANYSPNFGYGNGTYFELSSTYLANHGYALAFAYRESGVWHFPVTQIIVTEPPVQPPNNTLLNAIPWVLGAIIVAGFVMLSVVVGRAKLRQGK
jgi:hypothetical protein